MIAAFYKQKPNRESPYRQLAIVAHDGGWRVRPSGGVRWRPKQSEEIEMILAKSFDDAQQLFDTAYRKLQDEGWKPYDSVEPW